MNYFRLLIITSEKEETD